MVGNVTKVDGATGVSVGVCDRGGDSAEGAVETEVGGEGGTRIESGDECWDTDRPSRPSLS